LLLASSGLIGVCLGFVNILQSTVQDCFAAISIAMVVVLILSIPIGLLFWAMRSLDLPARSLWVSGLTIAVVLFFACSYLTSRLVCNALSAS
jgi:uncharacterized membrane protein YhfC